MDPTNWLPFQPEQPQHPRPTREAATWTEPFRDAYTPAPDILAALDFFPVYPPPAPQTRRSRQEAVVVVEPFDVPTRVAPEVWLPILGGPTPRPRRPRQERVTIDPTFGAALVTAAGMGWAPHLPDMPRPARTSPAPPLTVWSLEPLLIAAAVPCVELVDSSFAVTDALADTVTLTDFLGEALTLTDLSGEALC